jgi:hypothetical protein
LKREFVEAVEKAQLHTRAFQGLTEGLKETFGSDIAEWEEAIVQWEEDRTKPNPYKLREDRKLILFVCYFTH